MIEIRAGICPHCKDTIYSRANHDCMHCSCGACFIDGCSAIVNDTSSFDYIRTKGNLIPTTVKIMEFDYAYEAKQALYEDWNNRIDKYGRIEG